MRVGGGIHVGDHPISAEYHLVSMTSHRVGLETTESGATNRGKSRLAAFVRFFGVLRSVSTVCA